MTPRPIPWITRVQISNYRSIARCDVRLRPLTLLVGPNGSGKSNFLDALRFLSDAVAFSPYQAVQSRGGFSEILRRSDVQAPSLSVTVDVVLPWGEQPGQWAQGAYRVVIAPKKPGGEQPLEVAVELCTLIGIGGTSEFSVHAGHIDARDLPLRTRRVEPDRLLLPLVGSLTEFAPLARGLERMHFYHVDPSSMRQPEPGVADAVLGPTGEHLADVIGALNADHPATKRRVDEYLGAVTPGLEGVDRVYAGAYVTMVMRQRVTTGELEFGPLAMSDGTIRAVGVLAALFQPAVLTGGISLVGVEEPELALHPAAAGVLMDALTEASAHVQVVATSQSADLLDRDDIDADDIRVARLDNGRTVIGELDEGSARIVADRRMTVGELMRGNQLSPRQDV